MASLGGAVSFFLGGPLLLAGLVAGVAGLAAVAYWRDRDSDPGLTTEIALVLTTLLGALCTREAALAAGVGVALALLLAAKTPLHHFVRSVLTDDEGKDALIFAGATLVILPLLPNHAMGPYGALNPHSIWIVVLLVLGISTAGYVAVRLLGARLGLPIAGLASGFVSSVATIGAMADRVRKAPGLLGVAVSGAVLSTVATFIQLSLVIGATSLATLGALAGPLVCAGVTAALYGSIFTLRAVKDAPSEIPSGGKPGHAFNIATALSFAATLSVILLISAVLKAQFGQTGAEVAATVAGFVDAHSAAISIASLVAAGKMTPAEAVIPILLAVTTNTLTKAVVAWTTGGRAFALRVIPGLVLVVLAGWGGAWLAAGLFA